MMLSAELNETDYKDFAYQAAGHQYIDGFRSEPLLSYMYYGTNNILSSLLARQYILGIIAYDLRLYNH